MRLRRVSILLAVLAALSMAVASSGFTGGSGARPVEVHTVDSDSAYLGVDPQQVHAQTDERTRLALATVTNRVNQPMTVSVDAGETAPGQKPTLAALHWQDRLAGGQQSEVTAEVTCGNTTTTESVTLEVTATGTDIEYQTVQTLEIQCV